MSGALSGIRIVEMSAIGPAPFCGMMLADHGAEVTVVHRPGAPPDGRNPLLRSRRLVEADLKRPDGVECVRDLVRAADGLIEGYRPGVMERLGLGPETLLADNPRLVYGRVTGWGQTGPLAQAAGHDIDYIALAGALHAFGRAGGAPTPPINMVGDFGGGGMLLAFGMVAALLNAARSGRGQVLDAAMVDGSALMMSLIWGLKATAGWRDDRGVNLIDTGAHNYDTYECADGGWIAVGALEPQFYAHLRVLTGTADDPAFDARDDPAAWTDLKARLAAIFRTRPRDAWVQAAHLDACVAPVLSMTEAKLHPVNVARDVFIELDGVPQPAPAPRFSVTPAPPPRAPVSGG